ncbi:MAG: hypothetical protein AAFQ36_06025 [Pseudomonadota bacterium]
MGYDVVGRSGERISVKTVTSGNHVAFKKSTISEVDRVLVLRIEDIDGETTIDELYDLSVDELGEIGRPYEDTLRLTTNLKQFEKMERPDARSVVEVVHEGYDIAALETGTIRVVRDGVEVAPVKPVLRRLADQLNITILNANGNPKNTRSLGADVITAIQEVQST